MRFLSSACVKNRRIGESVRQLAEAGYTHIELTGGTQRYDGFERELLELRDELGLTYNVHNYFPPPVDHFVLNLASTDEDHWQRSLDHCREALTLAKTLGTPRYGVHAGFLVDLRAREVGERVKPRALFPREAGLARFARAFAILRDEFPDVALYVENNVLSAANHESLGPKAFLLTEHDGYLELLEHCPGMKLLLDLAHLKVSCQSLGLSLAEECAKLLPETDYLHISDNEGRADTNHGLLSTESDIAQAIAGEVASRMVTIEVYSGLDAVAATHATLDALSS